MPKLVILPIVILFFGCSYVNKAVKSLMARRLVQLFPSLGDKFQSKTGHVSQPFNRDKIDFAMIHIRIK